MAKVVRKEFYYFFWNIILNFYFNEKYHINIIEIYKNRN